MYVTLLVEVKQQLDELVPECVTYWQVFFQNVEHIKYSLY
jgi:hypothetical protein